MAEQATKKKLIRVLDILKRDSDEGHPLSAGAICAKLEAYGIHAERKGIYRDMDVLMDCGVDIVCVPGKSGGYYLADREFELAEVKLLVDAVQASKFITSKKTEQLIGKLKGLTSSYEAEELNREVYIYNRAKAEDETIYYTVDTIHKAMSGNKRISFEYTKWDVSGHLVQVGDRRVASPWALVWNDGNYYLIVYRETEGDIRYYRVDKMRRVEIEKESRLGRESFADFDLGIFSKKSFSMYHGEEEQVELRCNNSLAGVMIDRFGSELMLIPDTEQGFFRVRIPVLVSPQFYGWVAGLGDGIQIMGPTDVVQGYEAHLESILRIYRREQTKEENR